MSERVIILTYPERRALLASLDSASRYVNEGDVVIIDDAGKIVIRVKVEAEQENKE